MTLPTIPEYNSCISNPVLLHPPILAGGHPITCGTNIVKYAGGFCVVFPYQTPKGKYAVRCWHAEVSDTKTRCRCVADALKMAGLPYFADFEFYEDGIVTPQGIQPLVVMDWVEAKPLKKYLAEHINDSNTINRLSSNFVEMTKALHKHHFSHGDLQHGNIMAKDDGELMLVDYDSMFVPGLVGMKDEVKGLAGYQHESRWKNNELSEKADYFSELVIYTSLRALAKKPELWDKLNMKDTETLLFTGSDIRQGRAANIFHELKADGELSQLADTLCRFIATPHFSQLVPLEEAIRPVSDRIADKWKKGNGHTPQKGKMPDPEAIAKKWKQ